MIYVRNNDSGLCNRIKLLGQAIAWGIEFGQDVTHYYFYDLKDYLNLDESILPIQVRLPHSSEARIWLHNKYKAVRRNLHLSKKETRESIREELSKGNDVTINSWLVREPVGYIRYQKEIAEYLAPKAEFQVYANKVLNEVQSDRNGHLIALHMRRGDYKQWRGGKYYYGEDTYIKWIRELVREFGDDVCILLFTNEAFDVEYARKEVKHQDIYLMKGNAIQDLSTMSKCEYIAGPPSTFSEMAAYYGNALYLNLFEKEQKIRLKDFETLRENYEKFYGIEI